MRERGLSGTNTLAYSNGVTKKKKFYDIDTWGQDYKTFFFVTDALNQKVRVFVPDKLFQPSLTFEI
jgi:hypothetical protein